MGGDRVEPVKGHLGVGKMAGHPPDEGRGHVDRDRGHSLGIAAVGPDLLGQAVDGARIVLRGYGDDGASSAIRGDCDVIMPSGLGGPVNGDLLDLREVLLGHSEIDSVILPRSPGHPVKRIQS